MAGAGAAGGEKASMCCGVRVVALGSGSEPGYVARPRSQSHLHRWGSLPSQVDKPTSTTHCTPARPSLHALACPSPPPFPLAHCGCALACAGAMARSKPLAGSSSNKAIVDDRPVGARGAEYQAEKLTGARAQRGNLPGGAPRWVYEVKWKGIHVKNTYEPADCLVGWEKEMKHVDEQLEARSQLPLLNLAAQKAKEREAAALDKFRRTQAARARLMRLGARRALKAQTEDACLDDDDFAYINEGCEDVDQTFRMQDGLDEAGILQELEKYDAMLQMLRPLTGPPLTTCAPPPRPCPHAPHQCAPLPLPLPCTHVGSSFERLGKGRWWGISGGETTCALPPAPPGHAHRVRVILPRDP